MKKYQKKVIVCIMILAVVIALLVHTYNRYIYVNYTSLNLVHHKVGIIDGNLQKKYECIVDTNIKEFDQKESHGDEILGFLEDVSDLDIYYFNACDDKGKINSSKILEGLQWMKNNEVSFVDISLSSRKYSKEIDIWIKENKDKLIVYASYNNQKESSDYPAMYKYVKGSGINEEVMDDKKDIIYKTNEIIVNRKKKIEGNSFLSIITLLNDIKSK